ncbi:Hypothetical protein R9X50_00503700 [Acrodontium crateriforme]|uniref:Uncharacterized protein n=1 Tax=Acrodontium crateriforme TaxID=150365 RepID=A0AAQ3M764_9PEZI|nr:Hypothetical protein R9X50_00503700 [Acrodontium crateriforme]
MDQLHDRKPAAPIFGSGSEISDISALEDDTDEFGRKLFQQYRQRRRVENNAAGRPQAFRKARPGLSLSERLGRPLPGAENVPVGSHARTTSSGSNVSDPSLNVPRDWTRRDRRGTDWLQSSRTAVNGEYSRDQAVQSHYNANRTPELDYRDEPLASIEHTPPSMRRNRPDGTPSSMHHMNTTIQQAMESDDHDFTALSLLASTPPVNNRNRKIDGIARQEREEFERGSKKSIETSIEQRFDHLRPATATAIQQEAPRNRRRSVVSNKENVQPNGDIASRTKETTSLAGRTNYAVTFKNNQRTEHQRSDSYNLLRQLARVSSASPSPARPKSESEGVNLRPKNERQSQSPIQTTSRSKSEEPRQQQVKREISTTPPHVDSTPLSREKIGDTKTPVVTGAWVDTPAAEHQSRKLTLDVNDTNRNNIPAKAETKQIQSPVKPVHASSALADIIAKARTKTGANFGDTTLQSLENLIGEDPEYADHLTQADRDQRQEDLAIEAMNKHLRAASKSIKNANRGLRRVENKMEASQIGIESLYDTVQEPEKPLATPPSVIQHHGGGPCAHCGGSYQSVWVGLWTEFRSCFYYWDPTSSYGIRLTRLGFFCVLWFIWYVTENILCANYCKPEYAQSLEGWTLTPDMPVYPFVIPTLLFRPLKPLWNPVLEYITLCIDVWLAASMGEEAVAVDSVFIHRPVPRPSSVKKALTGSVHAAARTIDAVYSSSAWHKVLLMLLMKWAVCGMMSICDF